MRGARRLMGTSVILALFLSLLPSVQAQSLLVGISQIVEHPSLDSIRQGLTDTLKNSALGPQISIKYLNAQGDMTLSAQIAHKLVGERAAVLVGLSTPSTQHLLAAKSRVPIVFSGVNDPLGARLVANLQSPGGQVTGVMLQSPVADQLRLMKTLRPQLKTVGTIYNAGEDNSVFLVKEFYKAAKELQLQAVAVTAAKSSQVKAAAQALTAKVEAIYLPTDNTVISALGAVLQVGRQAKIPVFAADTASAEQGAVAALGLDHYELGRQTGELVLKILQGAKPANLAVRIPQKNELYLNLSLVDDQFGLMFPVSVLKQAKKILVK